MGTGREAGLDVIRSVSKREGFGLIVILILQQLHPNP